MRKVKIFIAGSDPLEGVFHKWHGDQAIIELSNGQIIQVDSIDFEFCSPERGKGSNQVQVRTK